MNPQQKQLDELAEQTNCIVPRKAALVKYDDGNASLVFLVGDEMTTEILLTPQALKSLEEEVNK